VSTALPVRSPLGGRHKISIHTSPPGPVATPQSRTSIDQELLDMFIRPRMLFCQTEDIVNYALFLAPDQSTWTTWTDLAVDGESRVAS
jgi:NAD(P)-dependent dehydrogenase (short-subunit alcohol dehydrogenase family)